jgi:hypothetical protein
MDAQAERLLKDSARSYYDAKFWFLLTPVTREFESSSIRTDEFAVLKPRASPHSEETIGCAPLEYMKSLEFIGIPHDDSMGRIDAASRAIAIFMEFRCIPIATRLARRWIFVQLWEDADTVSGFLTRQRFAVASFDNDVASERKRIYKIAYKVTQWMRPRPVKIAKKVMRLFAYIPPLALSSPQSLYSMTFGVFDGSFELQPHEFDWVGAKVIGSGVSGEVLLVDYLGLVGPKRETGANARGDILADWTGKTPPILALKTIVYREEGTGPLFINNAASDETLRYEFQFAIALTFGKPVLVKLDNGSVVTLTREHLTPCYGWVLNAPTYNLVMGFKPFSLASVIEEDKESRANWAQLPASQRMKFIPQRKTMFDYCRILIGIAHGLAYMHIAHKLVHRDVHTGNVLLDEDNNAFLADFGLVSPMGQPTYIIGELSTIPPFLRDVSKSAREVGDVGFYDYPNGACDVFALSVVMGRLMPDDLDFPGTFDERFPGTKKNQMLYNTWPELVPLRDACSAMKLSAIQTYGQLLALLFIENGGI